MGKSRKYRNISENPWEIHYFELWKWNIIFWIWLWMVDFAAHVWLPVKLERPRSSGAHSIIYRWLWHLSFNIALRCYNHPHVDRICFIHWTPNIFPFSQTIFDMSGHFSLLQIGYRPTWRITPFSSCFTACFTYF